MYLRHFQPTFTCQHVNPSGIAAPTPYLKSTYILSLGYPGQTRFSSAAQLTCLARYPRLNGPADVQSKQSLAAFAQPQTLIHENPPEESSPLQRGTSAEVTSNRAYKGGYLANGIYPGCSFY